MAENKKTILFINRDANIKKLYANVFVDADYNVFFVQGTGEALSLFARRSVDIMFCDIGLSDGKESEFYNEIKEKYPETTRIAFGADCEYRDFMNAIDNNTIRMYIERPCSAEDLSAITDRLVSLYDEFEDDEFKKIIDNIRSVPTLPKLYTKITSMMEKNSNMEDITRVIEEDQSISVRILKMANSAFYSIKTGSIQTAIMYIGLFNVKNIVLTNSIFRDLGVKSPILAQVWRQVNLTNKMLNRIYQNHMGKNIPDSFASAGLLHNLGKVILLSRFGEKYEELICEAAENKDEGSTFQIIKKEREVFGTDHQKLGAYLLNRWGIPIPMVEAAMYHHEPMKSCIIYRKPVYMVHVANFCASEIVFGKNNASHVEEEVLKYLRMNLDDVKYMISEFKDEDIDVSDFI